MELKLEINYQPVSNQQAPSPPPRTNTLPSNATVEAYDFPTGIGLRGVSISNEGEKESSDGRNEKPSKPPTR